MREYLLEANVENPQMRMICGFQPAFEVDADRLVNVLQYSQISDSFELLYTNEDIEVYELNRIRRSGTIKLHDIKYIAALNNKESWIVVQGLLAWKTDKFYYDSKKRAKKALIQAMKDMWDVEIRKGA